MAIDAITIALSGISSPIANTAIAAGLTATAVTKLAGSNTDATRVEFELLYAPLATNTGNGGVKPVISNTQDASSSPTGTYAVTFAQALFAKPGLYQVRAKGIVASGSPEVISNWVTVLSDVIQVTEGTSQNLDDVLTQIASHEVTLDDHEDRIADLETP